jgi:hypothetical protein
MSVRNTQWRHAAVIDGSRSSDRRTHRLVVFVLGPTTVVALRLGALAALLILAWPFGPASLRFALGFALVIGGGLGNASDVVLRDGAVVDFISTAPLTRGLLSGTSVEGVVLNLADVWVLAGLFLLYPLFRALGVAVQRRLVRLEERILGCSSIHPLLITGSGTGLPSPRPRRCHRPWAQVRFPCTAGARRSRCPRS